MSGDLNSILTENGLALHESMELEILYERDRLAITTEYKHGVYYLVKDGLRFNRSGTVAALWNNSRSYDAFPGKWTGGKYYRCIDQAETILRRLQKIKHALNFRWKFRLAKKPGHYWAEAVPPSSEFNVIVMDPWRDELTEAKTATQSFTFYHSGALDSTDIVSE